MANIIFVHGTGVRENSYLLSFNRARQQLKSRQDMTLHPCYWGNLGAKLYYGGASIPNYKKTLDAEQERKVALWGLLYEDPLYELRLLALRQPLRKSGIGPPPGFHLFQIARDFEPDAEMLNKLRQADLEATFFESQAAITKLPLFRRALSAAPTALTEYRAAIARAFLADALKRSKPEREPSELRIEADLREEIEASMVDALGGAERGLGWLQQKAGGLLASIGTWYARRHRSSLSDVSIPAAGDILLYQARGEEIRNLIRSRIEEVDSPVVLLAHSLGGVACAEVLLASPLGTRLLVTVGSQVPFLYEIGALRGMEVGSDLPDHFPSWINIYDSRDFLSYIGAGVFPGRVRDVEVDNQQPFPAAHGAYWENPQVWTAIEEALGK